MQTHAPSRPLAAHALFATTDLDEARDRVARVFCPHRLDRIGQDGLFDARQHHLPGERLSLNYIEYGAKTLIAPGLLERFYLVQIPLAGGAAIQNGGQHYYSGPRAAAVLNPHLPTTMIWEAGCRQLLVQIDRKALQDHLSAQLGAEAERPLTFCGAMDVTQGAGAALRRLVQHLVAEADDGGTPIGRGGLLARQIEGAILSGLLEGVAHSYSDWLGPARARLSPRPVRQAEEFIMANLDRPITLEEVAQAAGTGVRALQLAFRRFRGTTPLGFWRDARLAAAHRELSEGTATSVTDVALRWGFSHFGRFAECYRRRHGRTPSETLRAARGIGFEG